MRTTLALLLAAAAMIGLPEAADAAATELRMTCSSDGNECEVTDKLLKELAAKDPGVAVRVDIVPYKAILESLPVQLAAGEGPDMARLSDLGGLSRYYLDLSPYVDRAYWEASFADTLPWYRPAPEDKGIYGMPTQLTITGAFVNKTLFEQAGVPMPEPKAGWEAWAAAAREVAKATETPFAMAIDRSGHRIGGPAISFGARYFDGQGRPRVVDEGFKAFAERFVAWNKDGTMARDVWAAQGGSSYQDAAQEFTNARVVLYYSGSWQVGRFEKAIGDAFDWVAIGSPCGPAACTGMPGGSGLVGFKSTRHPAEVAKVIDYLASEPVHERLMAETRNIPAHRGLARKGVAYPGASPQAAAALKAFTRAAADLSPTAFAYQGYRYNRAMFNASVTRLTQAIVGELSLDDALARIDKDVADAVKAAGG